MRVTVSLAALIAVLAAVSAAYFSPTRGVDEPHSHSAAPVPAPVYSQVIQSAPSIDEIASTAQDRNRQLALAIERALVSRDSQHRETAFNLVLPELLREEPDDVIAMMARQEPGEARDALRDEVARQWITTDRNAAIEWMNSLEQADRAASATIAMRTLAAIEPAKAIAVADQFGVGRDDGSLEHMVQIWATEKPDEALRWIEAQPPGAPRTAQLRARIVAALDDDVCGAELARKLLPIWVAAHCDDSFRTELFGRKHGANTDRSIANDDHRLARADFGSIGAEPAGAEHVRGRK